MKKKVAEAIVPLNKKFKEKTRKHKLETYELEKAQAVYGEPYFNVRTVEEDQMFPQRIEGELARQLVEWADFNGDDKNEPSMRISEFRLKHGICRKTWEAWITKYPTLAGAQEYALEKIAHRREYGAAIRRFNDSTIARTIGYFDTEISRQEQIRLAKLRDENSVAKVPDIVFMPAVEKTKELDEHTEKKSKK